MTGEGYNTQPQEERSATLSVQNSTTVSSSASSSSPACDAMRDRRFTRQADQDKWDRLCVELPPETPVPERLALLAEMDCSERTANRHRTKRAGGEDGGGSGQPISNVLWGESADPKVLKWIHGMGKSNDLVAFECFHRPDVV